VRLRLGLRELLEREDRPLEPGAHGASVHDRAAEVGEPAPLARELCPMLVDLGRNRHHAPTFADSSFTALTNAIKIGCMSKTSTSSVSSSSVGLSFIRVVETHSGKTSRTFSASNP